MNTSVTNILFDRKTTPLDNGESSTQANSDGETNNSTDVITEAHLKGGQQNSEAQVPKACVKPEKPPWNTFRLPRRVILRSSDESGALEVPRKVLKILCYFFTFSLVLGTACIANIVLFLMASQVPEQRTLDLCLKEANKRYIVTTSPSEQTGWLCCLWLCLVASEVLILFISVWKVFHKSLHKPSLGTFFLIFTTEGLHAVGLSLLMFFVLHKLNSILALMLINAMDLIPALLHLVTKIFHRGRSFIKAFPHFLIFACLMAFFGWLPFQMGFLPMIAAVLTSFGWWENFVHPGKGFFFTKFLGKAAKELQTNNRHYFARFIVGPWKIIIFTVSLYIRLYQVDDNPNVFSNLYDSFTNQKVTIVQKWQTSDSAVEGVRGLDLTSDGFLPLYFALIQIAACHLCYFAALFACRIKIDQKTFSFPISLVAPISLLILTALCSFRMENECLLSDMLPEYIFWNCPKGDFVKDFLLEQHGWTWIVLMLAQLWITSYIWETDHFAVNETEGYFINPTYLSPAICQSLLFNRKQIFESQVAKNVEKASKQQEDSNKLLPGDKRITVYGCATMWHETKEEMKTIIKSILSLDMELKERENSRDPSKNYNFELHIFFDNAFEEKRSEKVVETPERTKTIELNDSVRKYQVNKYVQNLVEVIKQSGKNEFTKEEDAKAGKQEESRISSQKRKKGKLDDAPKTSEQLENEKAAIRISDPEKLITPYGGCLVWTLPFGTKIHAHLKDSEIVRHKKRWSQVMYMYYLLGFKLRERSKPENWDELEQNTFLLALDGDVDFQPDAISKLLDLMLQDKSLGAACGRIHPVGTGLIVWYQKFEYAIGHWLQKATEHVLGCVLCSPGCFSLFRAKALSKVVKQYSSKAELPLHRLQYDQGEDRWLCTLILKQGHRIEYSAASDAYTNCPDSFQEFYTQRKRWGPSTMANIFDLIADYHETVKKNEFISRPYIIYQLIMMIGSIIGPGTIFLMIVGAMISAFQVTSWVAFLINTIPIVIFSVTCFFVKEKYQV